MTQLRFTVLVALLVSGSTACAQQEKKKPDDSDRVREVTLYRDQALVTREITIPVGDGPRTVIANLPNQVIADSVFAEGVDGIVVRAVRVSVRPVVQTPENELLRLRQEAEALDERQVETLHAISVVNEDLEALSQMIRFSATKGGGDLERGVLNAETLTQLSEYSMTQRRKLSSEQFKLKRELAELDAQRKQVQAKLMRGMPSQTGNNFQAWIFAESAKRDGGQVRLNYSVAGCGWSPQYTVHGRTGRDMAQVRYSAVVHQMTGEDWDGVQLVLSTASPNVNAARPLLTALEVTAADPGKHQAANAGGPFGPAPTLAESIQSLRSEQQNIESTLHDQFDVSSERRDVALNVMAGQMQQIEFRAKSQSWRNLAPDVKRHVASQVYQLPERVSVNSREEQQFVQILEFELNGKTHHVATPLLSTYAYRELQTTNTQPVGLLGGPATIYLDDRFVGRMQLPSTASGQRITIGFGADQQVRTRRELLNKQDLVQGGNRLLKLDYRLVVSNFKGEAISVRLVDRMPHTRQEQQLSVKLEQPQNALSADALYQRVERPTGILRWDLNVPAGRHGSEAFDVDYNYTMTFDRNHVPTTGGSFAELQSQYRNSQMGGMGGMGGGMGGP